MIVPCAEVVTDITSPGSSGTVTTKPSSPSWKSSPTTGTVINWLASYGWKVTVPPGRVAPAKSAALAGLAPLPATCQLTVPNPSMGPTR